MTTYFSIPVPIELPISIISTMMISYRKVTISAPFDISNIDWNIDDIPPRLKTVKNGGKIVILIFSKTVVAPYNLLSGGLQCNYMGNNLLVYLQTADTGFGSFVTNPQSGVAPMVFLAGLAALLIGGATMT